MIPETISYTGLELSPSELERFRVHPGPIPVGWTTVVFRHDDFNTRKIINWVLDNIDGRFGVIITYPYAVIYFESDINAVMFRLKDGEREIKALKDSSF